jgi:GNAT superfamily N-acetyltransferase
MSSSPPEPRPVAAGDFAALAKIVREVEASFGLRVASTDRDVREWTAPVELATDSLVLERAGRPAAFGWIFWRDLPEWRSRGVGRALLLHAFRAFYERGQPRVGLGVDAQNSTGALPLYESVGMHVEAEEIVFELELP